MAESEAQGCATGGPVLGGRPEKAKSEIRAT